MASNCSTVGAVRVRLVAFLGIQVGHLPADHAHGPGGGGQVRTASRREFRRLDILGDDLERQRQQGVPGQNRHRFAELFVIGGPAPAEIIIIHRRQIIMNQ